MEHLPQLMRVVAPANLDLSVLNRVLSYPTWNFVQEAIRSTRSYEEGLEAGLAMYRFLDDLAREHLRSLVDDEEDTRESLEKLAQ